MDGFVRVLLLAALTYGHICPTFTFVTYWTKGAGGQATPKGWK